MACSVARSFAFQPATWANGNLTTTPGTSTLDAVLTGLEVTQAIQDLQNSVTLIAEKATSPGSVTFFNEGIAAVNDQFGGSAYFDAHLFSGVHDVRRRGELGDHAIGWLVLGH